MHYIRLVVLGDSQVGKTSLIRQLVGEELKSGPELKCEAQVEAVQTRIEKTWLSELNDHESKLEQALATKRLASLLASQIELQQLLLKQQQQQQQRGNKLAADKNTPGSSKKQSESLSRAGPDKAWPKCSPSSTNCGPLQGRPECPERPGSSNQLESKREFAITGETQQHTGTPDNGPPADQRNKCLQEPHTESSDLAASGQQPEPGCSGEGATKGAPNSSSLSSHQTQLTYQEIDDRLQQHSHNHQQQRRQQKLERPTILISSSSAASSSTNLCEQNELQPDLGHANQQGRQPLQAPGAAGRAPRGEELIEITCGRASRDAPIGNQQFNDGCGDRNRAERGPAGGESSEQCPSSTSGNQGPASDWSKLSSSINQPLELAHNRNDSAPCVPDFAGSLPLQQQQQQEQSRQQLQGNRQPACEEPTRANKTSAWNANHVPVQRGRPLQKGHSNSFRGNFERGETSTVGVRLDESESRLGAIEAPQASAAAATAVATGRQQGAIGGTGQQTIPVHSQQEHEQLRQMRSLDVCARKLTAKGPAMAGSDRDIHSGKDDAAAGAQKAGATTKSTAGSPSHHHHQHRHSYCAPGSPRDDAPTTSGTSGSRFAVTKDELSTQARIINILFSSSKSAAAAAAASAAMCPSNSASSATSHEPKSSAPEAAPSSGNKPLLMPALLRQYQRRLSNFHSHSSSQQQQQHGQHAEQASSSGQNQRSAVRVGDSAVIDRKSSIVQVMSELILAEQRRRAQLVKEAARAAATLATSAAAAAQALLVARSSMISTREFKTLMDDQRLMSQLDFPSEQLAACVPEEADERSIALERLPLPIFGGCQPSSWIRGSETLDEHGICHEANLYALTEEYRLKLASNSRAPSARVQTRAGAGGGGGVSGATSASAPRAGHQQNNEQSGYPSSSSSTTSGKQAVQLAASSLATRHRRLYTATADANEGQKYDIKHFCANYIDNMNLYEIKIVDMPTIEPVSEFPTSSLLEWSLFKGRSHLLTADAYLLVFDLTRPSTIQYIKMLRDKIFESREMSNVPVYVIANKADLCPTLQPSLQARQMRNVAVHRHQASLNSGATESSGANAASDSAGQSSHVDQCKQQQQQQKLGPKSASATQDQRTKSKWHLMGSISKRRSTTKRPTLCVPPPPTTYNLSSEQRSVPAAAAHQLLAAYKMHRMRLGGSGPIVSLRRWAKLRRAVALNEPHSFAGGLAGYPGAGAMGNLGASPAWSQFERKRMHYSLIIGASGGLDSRRGPGLSGSNRMGAALGRVRSCIQTSWCLLKTGGRGRRRRSRNNIRTRDAHGKRRYRSKLPPGKFKAHSNARKKRRKSRATRVRDRTESALIRGAKRRKSSIFLSPFSWNQGHELAGKRTNKTGGSVTGRGAKVAGGKNVAAATRRSNWSNWLHLSAPCEGAAGPAKGARDQRAGSDDAGAADRQQSTTSGTTTEPAAITITWGQRLGLKRKRASCSNASLGSAGSNSRGILKLAKRGRLTLKQRTGAPTASQRRALPDKLATEGPVQSTSIMHNKRESNTDHPASPDAGQAVRQSDADTMENAPPVVCKRRLVEPVCGAMSTPASRQTFYDLFNRLLQTSSATAAKTQLKLGAIQTTDTQKRGDCGGIDGGSGPVDNNGTNSQAGGASLGQGGHLLKITLDEQQSDKKSKRRKSSSTGAALWQTLSSLALSRISQSGDRKGSGQKLDSTSETCREGARTVAGAPQRSATVLGGRLSVTSRASGCSITGSTIHEDPLQQDGVGDGDTNRREAQTNLLSSDGLRLGTDQYLSVDMLRKLSLISSHSQLSGGGEIELEGEDGDELSSCSKRPKSEPSEPVGMAQVLRRASKAWIGTGKIDRHRRQHEGETNADECDGSPRPHASPERGASAGVGVGGGAKRYWYRGVVKKILFHSNKQSLKGIVTAMELQRKADEEAARAAEEATQAQDQPKGDNEHQPHAVAKPPLLIDEVQPEPSTSAQNKQPKEEEKPDEEVKQSQVPNSQQLRRQSLAVVQAAPAIRIITSGSSMSLVSGSSDPNRHSTTPTANPTGQHQEPEKSENIPLKPSKDLEVGSGMELSVRDQESSTRSTARQTMSTSSSAASLASSSASLSESVTLNLAGNNNASAQRTSAPDADRAATGLGNEDLDEANENDTSNNVRNKSNAEGQPEDEKSGSSSCESGDGSEDEDSSPLGGLGEPQLSYQLRKLSADDCLIINRHRRQSLAAMQDGQALNALKNRSDEQKPAENEGGPSCPETKGEVKADQQPTGVESGPSERAVTGEEGRRQSIKQSIEAAIHLLVPRAKARSASITLGATDCEHRSRSQLGTAIMGAVNVHKTWRDWRQLLGRKKSAVLNKETALGNLCDKVIAPNGTPTPSASKPSFAFSGGHLLSDSFSTNGVAPPPIVGFLSSHVAYKKLSADQQREAAINFDQLMRINQLTLTAANVVMLAASQPPIRHPLSTHQTVEGAHNGGGKKRRRHHHHHQHNHNRGEGGELTMKDAAQGRDNKEKSPKATMESEDLDDKNKSPKGRRRKQNQQEGPSNGSTGFQPLMTRIQSGGNLLLRKSSVGGDKAGRTKRKAAKAARHEEAGKQVGTCESTRQSDPLFVPLALLSADMSGIDPDQAADLLRVQSVFGPEDSGSAATTATAAAAAAAALASSPAPPAEGDISAQIAAAAASALERQRRRGERLSAILEPRYDKKQPGAEYPIFVSHDLNPILKDLAQLVRKHWKCNYIECSAASNWNIRPIISELTRALECNNRLSTSSSGISVGDDQSDVGATNAGKFERGLSRADRVFKDDDDEDEGDDESSHSGWSDSERDFRPGEDDNDDDGYDDDKQNDSALSSDNESSYVVTSSDEGEAGAADRGVNTDGIRVLSVSRGDRRRPGKSKRSSKSARRSSGETQVSKCSIM